MMIIVPTLVVGLAVAAIGFAAVWYERHPKHARHDAKTRELPFGMKSV